MSIEVVTLGEAMVGLVATEPGPLASSMTFARHIAGAEANVAVGLARLGHRAAYIGRVGDDGFGTAILRALRGEGVEVDHLAVDETARTAVFVRERRLVGAADLIYHRAGSAASRLDSGDVTAAADLFAAGRWLHLTGITPALSATCRGAIDAALDLAVDVGMTISVDVNLRRKLWSEDEAGPVIRSMVERADVVFASLDEADLLIGGRSRSTVDAAAGLLALGPAIAVLKLGSAGAIARERDKPGASHEGFPVPLVLDPVGAGDAFVAGFIAARLEALDLATALAWGNAAGASVAATVGDMTGLPTRRELDAILGSGPDTLR